MKKVLMVFVLIAVALVARAQEKKAGYFTIQPKIGVSSTALTDMVNGEGATGVIVGAEGEYRVKKWFGAAVGLVYSMQGTGYENSDRHIYAHYLNVPIVANFYVWKGLALKIGIQPGFLMKAKEKFDNGHTVNWSSDCNRVDFSVPVGISYDFSRFVVDVRYNIGMTELFKEGIRNDEMRNLVIQLTLGYKFRL